MRRLAHAARARPEALATACVLAGLLVAGAGMGSVWGLFTANTTSAGNVVVAASDWAAPTVSTAVIQKAEGGTAGYIRQGGAYRVYATTADAGNPATGVASARANVSAVTAGQTAAPLGAGSFTVGAQTYNQQSAQITAAATLAAGSYAYSVTASDGAGNTRVQTGFSVVVDNTAPAASDMSAANKTGNIAGRPELGDVLTLTYSEPVEPGSISAGWTGASPLNAVVRIDNNVAAYAGNDVLTVYNAANTAALPLGTLNLGRTDYVVGNRTFGLSGVFSLISPSGSSYAITLGTASGTTTTASASGTMGWTPATGAIDRAGNFASTATLSEPGAADKEF